MEDSGPLSWYRLHGKRGDGRRVKHGFRATDDEDARRLVSAYGHARPGFKPLRLVTRAEKRDVPLIPMV